MKKKPRKHVEMPMMTSYDYINNMKMEPQKQQKAICLRRRYDIWQILYEQFVSAFIKEDIASVPTTGTSTANSAPSLNIPVNGVKTAFWPESTQN